MDTVQKIPWIKPTNLNQGRLIRGNMVNAFSIDFRFYEAKIIRF